MDSCVRVFLIGWGVCVWSWPIKVHVLPWSVKVCVRPWSVKVCVRPWPIKVCVRPWCVRTSRCAFIFHFLRRYGAWSSFFYTHHALGLQIVMKIRVNLLISSQTRSPAQHVGVVGNFVCDICFLHEVDLPSAFCNAKKNVPGRCLKRFERQCDAFKRTFPAVWFHCGQDFSRVLSMPNTFKACCWPLVEETVSLSYRSRGAPGRSVRKVVL